MGRAKFGLPFGAGHTFASRLAATLDEVGIAPLLLVSSPDGASDLRAALGEYLSRAAIVLNERPDDGQLASLQAGLRMIAPTCAAALVTLVDLPAVRPATVSALLSEWDRTRAPLVRPVRLGRHGHPFIAGHAVLDSLRAVPHTTTIREVLQPFVPLAIDVVTDDEGAFDDVDTPGDYERLVKRYAL
jgi:molybdenum cofactor cytidylyltransferase